MAGTLRALATCAAGSALAVRRWRDGLGSARGSMILLLEFHPGAASLVADLPSSTDVSLRVAQSGADVTLRPVAGMRPTDPGDTMPFVTSAETAPRSEAE